MKHTIPIHSRMVHMKDGSSSSLQYDPHNQASSGFSGTEIKKNKNNKNRPMPIAHLTHPSRRSIL